MVTEEQDIEFSIVSGSNEEMLLGCIHSLIDTMKESKYRWSMTVTCNATSEGLAGRLRAQFPQTFIIDNEESKGFAANHNRVLASSPARYVWLLNDDLVILPDAVRLVTEFMDRSENSRVAVASPRLLNPDGSLQPSTYGFPSMPQTLLAHSGLRDVSMVNAILGRVAPILRSREGSSRFWAHDKTVVVDTLRGACVAMRMKAVGQVGPMVEVAIVGGEETEWHRRFHERGWKVVYFPDASVIHYGSQTVGTGAANLYPEYLKGALYFFRTGRSSASYSRFCAALLTVFSLRAAIAWITRNPDEARIAKAYAAVAWNGLLRR